jgi:hypothetical protein
MERLKESQEALTLIYTAYNKAALMPLATLDVNDEPTLKKMLNTVMNRESIAHMQHTKILKQSSELRSSLADVLLLLDNCDIKEIKAAMKKATATATAAEVAE